MAALVCQFVAIGGQLVAAEKNIFMGVTLSHILRLEGAVAGISGHESEKE